MILPTPATFQDAFQIRREISDNGLLRDQNVISLVDVLDEVWVQVNTRCLYLLFQVLKGVIYWMRRISNPVGGAPFAWAGLTR